MNPDHAHYCGRCGQRLPGEGDWRLYDYSRHTAVAEEELSRLRRATQQIKDLNLKISSLQSQVATLTNERNRARSEAEGLRPYRRMYYDLEHKRNTNKLGTRLKRFFVEFFSDGDWLIVGGMALVWIVIWLWPFSCSSSKMGVVNIDGKYGIGTDAENLKVAAVYDSISTFTTGNQWILYDKVAGKFGVAYVDDDSVAVIKPEADGVSILANGLALVSYGSDPSTKKVYVGRRGAFRNDHAYRNVYWAGKDWMPTVMWFEDENGRWDFMDANAVRTTFERYDEIWFMSKTLFRAYDSRKHIHQLYDNFGKKIGGPMYSIAGFSDGVAWSFATEADRKAGKLTLIDSLANVLCTIDNVKRGWGFNNGIGYYKAAGGRILAVDKAGKVEFQLPSEIEDMGDEVDGVRPVYRKSGSKTYVGLMDAKGKVTTPMDYEYLGSLQNLNYPINGLKVKNKLGRKGFLYKDGTFS